MTTTTMNRSSDIQVIERAALPASSPLKAAPRWARRAAVLAVLTTIPSALWRMAMAVGVPVGVSEEVLSERFAFPGWGTVYVFGLSLGLVGLASLTLALVQRWGEEVPRWMPVIGGKRVPPMTAVVPASVGAGLLTLLWASIMSNFSLVAEEFGLEGEARAVVVACYAPLLLWGPLLAAVTVSYHRRRRANPRSDGRDGTEMSRFDRQITRNGCSPGFTSR